MLFLPVGFSLVSRSVLYLQTSPLACSVERSMFGKDEAQETLQLFSS